MSQATITSKGQITIPSAIRAKMKVAAGDKVEFIEIEDGKFEMIALTREVTSLKGLFKTDKAVSIAAMNKAIAEKAAN
jgi:AbrB family looped-hinge helix DNA binding protein